MAKRSTSKLFPNEDVKKEKKETPLVDMDVDISAIRKKRVRINGDDDKIIELNISDMNIINRLERAYDNLNNYMEDVYKALNEKDDSDGSLTSNNQDAVFDTLNKIDEEMRREIDYIFDSPVSDKCADGGSMWDPLDGAFRYEHIIEVLLGLYESNLNDEFNKMKSRVDSKVQDHKKAVSKYHK